MSLRIAPVTLDQANAFVARLHRHNKPVTGYRFAVGCEAQTRLLDGPEWVLCGVAIVGRPVSPKLDDGRAAEITRLCTDGTANACSMLYAAARRAARAMGLGPVYTYTLPTEGGASLRAAGFHLDKTDAGGPARLWQNRPGRTVAPVGDDLFGGKWRWTDQPLAATQPDGGQP
ncbi:MAG: XF1762 family protein [Aquabacterium sp.]|uniref:XF1762 family protein n=1 Tax=Aquabacterium sp. TaxID=1872578 RepID=UPI003BAF426B